MVPLELPDDLPLGWRTDLAVLGFGGSVFTSAPDHLIVRTPTNPTYHWGNFVLVTDPAAVNDADRWRSVFAEAFPEARHLAIGLTSQPDAAAWSGTELEQSDVLLGEGKLRERERERPSGYEVRPVATESDWNASTALNDECYRGEGDFARLRSASRAAMVERGQLTWFGAFTSPGDELASELGILTVGDLARYQSVLTHPDHRRRGLTSHLLAVAANHARSAGASTLVIIADADGDAGRLYRAAGFRYAETLWQAYAKPAIA